jgi:hypothetical protein
VELYVSYWGILAKRGYVVIRSTVPPDWTCLCARNPTMHIHVVGNF